MANFKRNNHFTIFGWMTDKLGLKGTERVVYAIIYSFSQNIESEFYGGHKYMAEAATTTVATIKTALKSLEEKGLIRKAERENDGISRCRYAAFIDEDGTGRVNNLPTINSCPGEGKNLSGGRDKNLPSYNKDNINNKKENKKEIIKNLDMFESDSPEYKHNKWFAENFPTLAKNKRPLKYKTYIALQAKYAKDTILMKLNEMEAKADFNRKYSDVGRVLWVWLERDSDQKKIKKTAK